MREDNSTASLPDHADKVRFQRPVGGSAQRLTSLDGLRAVAVFAVVFYHYLYRWAELPGAYPYNAISGKYLVIQYGSYGVALFFVISGFVISLTLEHCKSLRSFAIKRVARLYPALILCTSITWFLLVVLPVELFPHNILSFLPSLTMIDPNLFNKVFGVHINAMDGAYWSIFAEVKFYCYAGVIYFLKPLHFPRNFLLFSIVVLGVYNFFGLLGFAEGKVWMKLLFLSDSLPWFLFGIAFYNQYATAAWKVPAALTLLGQAQLCIFSWYSWTLTHAVAGLVVPVVFLSSLYFGPLQKILSTKVLTVLGLSSYSSYLLHQFAGVSLIAWTGQVTELSGNIAFTIAFIVAVAIGLLAISIYYKIERPLNAWLVARFA